ncbi:HupE/UreJ family protein [Daejeonella sp.]|uniref:HupE/UreJ family protein n=1 Tax=Daejeonella sp. TaxID=2805397 RepID=UPI00398387F6
MGQFELYFQLGINHILDIGGLDHILFVVVLCSLYPPGDWKKIIFLVTAFTIGHSVTLALATHNLINVNAPLIEFLIPLTIAITAISNLLNPQIKNGLQLNYLFAFFFGLIHGLGFSNYLKALLGNEVSILNPLFAFNIGLEAGQLIIVASFLIFSSLPLIWFKVKQRDWTIVISSSVLGMSLMMMIDTKFW